MDTISIRGARTHNLKNIDVEIPRHKFVVITGPSGSGKSSLAFDTIYAEGQRRYVESLSTAARQFIAQMPRPDVDAIEGLSPTVAISQIAHARNPRSTVGTATDLYNFLRLLFARAGTPHCPTCKTPIAPLTIEQMVDQTIATLPEGTRFAVLSPAIRKQKGNLLTQLKRLQRDGYVRVAIDGTLYDLGEPIKLDARKFHDLDIYIDRLVAKSDITNRLADSLELALKESDGLAIISPIGEKDITFTDRHSCATCGTTTALLEPADFSFNTPSGACDTCGGLGVELFFEEGKIIPNPHLSIRDGAIAPWSKRNAPYYQQMLNAVITRYGIDPFSPWRDLPKNQRHMLLFGTDDEMEFTITRNNSRHSYKKAFEGVIPNLERRSQEYDRRKKEKGATDDGDYLSMEFTRYMSSDICPTCNGARLKAAALHVTCGEQNIAQVCEMNVERALHFVETLKLPTRAALVAEPIIREIRSRLFFLLEVGLGYLNLNRSVYTLSGGEAQRIRLANQLGSAMVGVTYVLDEPSIGLHQRDHEKLLATILNLKNRGNTVIAVEHDMDTMCKADYLIDMGPAAGVRGGKITAVGSLAQIRKTPQSLTGQYLSGKKSIPMPSRYRQGAHSLWLKNATTNNLKGVTVKIPLGVFSVVTGVSGSGKSSLIMNTLLPALRTKLHGTTSRARVTVDALTGVAGRIDKVIAIDQSPIGRTPRSNPATFSGVLTEIREVFAATTLSRQRGYKPGRYSFNIKGGRCEACQGDGQIRIEMNFLPDSYATCEICSGKRYNRETLEVTYRGMNVAQVLDMTINQASAFFENHPKIQQKLHALREVGLGYLKLGQNAATLSGGEAQRLKLAKELAKSATGQTIYIMDEPTTGLHFEDIAQLLGVLERLVDQGNTLVVIEHNLDIIKNADWIIDMGPDGGENGGAVTATGTPLDIAKTNTHTGQYLKKVLKRKRRPIDA